MVWCGMVWRTSEADVVGHSWNDCPAVDDGGDRGDGRVERALGGGGRVVMIGQVRERER